MSDISLEKLLRTVAKIGNQHPSRVDATLISYFLKLNHHFHQSDFRSSGGKLHLPIKIVSAYSNQWTQGKSQLCFYFASWSHGPWHQCLSLVAVKIIVNYGITNNQESPKHHLINSVHLLDDSGTEIIRTSYHV